MSSPHNPLEPLNDTARVTGNPSSTLMRSSVGNCFPGLEFDIRGLDRRFFPGLVFDFPGSVEAGPDGTQGAKLVQIEPYDDPMLDGDESWVPALQAAFDGAPGSALGDGDWWLHALTQDGVRIELYEFLYWQNSITRVPYKGETVWWIIRGLRPGPVRAELTRRDAGGRPSGHPVILDGARRQFVNDDGVFDPLYRAGELTASLCSPWTHDFRDCTCHYWASNHPDVVMGEVAAGDELPDGQSASDAAQGVTFLDWMRRRSDPAKDVSAATTIDEAREHRYDPYEINHAWQELSFVLEGREIARPYAGRPPEPDGEGFDSPAELIGVLEQELAPLELALAAEYLYAKYSLESPDSVDDDRYPGLSDALRAARQLMTLTAISEMTHLRWANQMLWLLYRHGLFPKNKTYTPILVPAHSVPTPPHTDGEARPRALRPLTPEVLAEFVYVERPTGDVDAAYEAAVRELEKNDRAYPPGLYEIAVRIDTDGIKHYERFRDIERVLAPYYALPGQPCLRKIRPGKPSQTESALALYAAILGELRDAYRAEANGKLKRAEKRITAARQAMNDLDAECERLACDGIGVDFFYPFEDHDA